jgi:threonine aldolase
VQVIDLRSDFLTRPTPAMRRAMEAAALEPAQFGLREDPHQAALERRAAAVLGKEDALLFPTCTMANEAALMVLTRPGEIVAAQADAHIITSEAGAPAALAGVSVVPVPGAPIAPLIAEWETMARRNSDELRSRVGAFVLENTHNRGGGAMLSAAYTREVCGIAHRHGIGVHIDGARLCNAAVAQSCRPSDLADACDTVAVSLNKGLSAPLGAVLAGSRALIERALIVRQRLGGGIRPTNIVSAAARVALEDWSHLAEDHRRAHRLAERLAGALGLRIDPAAIATNIVVAGIPSEGPTPEAFCVMLAERGVLALPFGAGRIRFVIYRDIDDDAIDRAADIVVACCDRS